MRNKLSWPQGVAILRKEDNAYSVGQGAIQCGSVLEKSEKLVISAAAQSGKEEIDSSVGTEALNGRRESGKAWR